MIIKNITLPKYETEEEFKKILKTLPFIVRMQDYLCDI